MSNQHTSNKYFKPPQLNYPATHSAASSSSTATTSNDRLIWEMRNMQNQYRQHNYQFYRNRTPSSTVLNSPDLNDLDEFQLLEQYQMKVSNEPNGQNEAARNGLNVLDSQPQPPSENINEGDVVVFDDIEDQNLASNWMQQQYSSHLLALSPTSSQSSTTSSNQVQEQQQSKNRVTIGGLHIADLQRSPRRFGNLKPGISSPSFRPSPSPNINPKRPPGFPQRIISPTEPGVAPEGKKEEEAKIRQSPPPDPPFDYLYEFSETRKVLDQFFSPQQQQDFQQQQLLQFQKDTKRHGIEDIIDYDSQQTSSYIGQRLAMLKQQKHQLQQQYENRDIFKNKDADYLDSGENSRSSCCEGENCDEEDLHAVKKHQQQYYHNDAVIDDELEAHNYYLSNLQQSKNFTLSPETTDYDSNCGDLDSELSLKYMGSEFGMSGEINGQQDMCRLYSSMPVLEDGLSSGHASDSENNNPNLTILLEMESKMTMPQPLKYSGISSIQTSLYTNYNEKSPNKATTEDTESIYSMNVLQSSPQPEVHKKLEVQPLAEEDLHSALKDIRSTTQRIRNLTEVVVAGTASIQQEVETTTNTVTSPVWVPRSNQKNNNHLHTSKESLNSSTTVGDNQIKLISGDEEEADTDLETDRLLGQQRLDELQGGFDDNKNLRKIRCANGQITTANITKTHTSIRHGIGTQPVGSTPPSLESPLTGDDLELSLTSPTKLLQTKSKSPTSSIQSKKELKKATKGCKNKEGLLDPTVLIEGVLFRARYLGSTQLVCEGQPTKSTRMMQAEEAVSRIKAPDGESQPSTEVDLFISTEKIMVLNTDLKEIMMDHALRTISYIADIGDLVVLMARRRFVPDADANSDGANENTPPTGGKGNRTPKMICHVFESEEAQFIAQSIGQAFQVAYMEFLKANGIEDHSFMKEMDYQEVLNSQEIFGDELAIFAKKELQKEVVVPKAKGEILGVVIVESGWGSMLPTVVIANLASTGAAARCGQLNIGDQIIAINGLSLVGLPLSQCQTYIKNTKAQTAVKFTVVPCAPVVEVKIKRPNTKYQLGFSVQNGVICSLLRGGIAERGGVRVGHRIIEINNQSVVAVPHEKIVNLLATSVGEILMKTMPTSMFRLLTGQENPIYI